MGHKLNRTQIMRKNFLCTLISLLTGICLAGCGTSPKAQSENNDSALHIVAAIFPAWDWTRNILADTTADAELTLLLDNGVDLHSYQPSVEDILTISNADLFIYVGGESDQWVTDALKQSNNPDMRIIKMIDVIGDAARYEETVEGMQAEAEDEEEETYDEHVWLSLRNAQAITEAIANELSTLDPAHAGAYQKNAAAYNEKLSDLDEQYTQAIRKAPVHTLLFGDRFPFLYLTKDYHLTYYAAFSGCSAETEASFETISFLAQKCDELGLKTVLTIDGSDRRIAETIVKNTAAKNQEILTLDSIQSVTGKAIENGATYLSIMENNLNILKLALEVK